MIHRHVIRLPNGKWFMILLAPSSYQALGRLGEHERTDEDMMKNCNKKLLRVFFFIV